MCFDFLESQVRAGLENILLQRPNDLECRSSAMVESVGLHDFRFIGSLANVIEKLRRFRIIQCFVIAYKRPRTTLWNRHLAKEFFWSSEDPDKIPQRPQMVCSRHDLQATVPLMLKYPLRT